MDLDISEAQTQRLINKCQYILRQVKALDKSLGRELMDEFENGEPEELKDFFEKSLKIYQELESQKKVHH